MSDSIERRMGDIISRRTHHHVVMSISREQSAQRWNAISEGFIRGTPMAADTSKMNTQTMTLNEMRALQPDADWLDDVAQEQFWRLQDRIEQLYIDREETIKRHEEELEAHEYALLEAHAALTQFAYAHPGKTVLCVRPDPDARKASMPVISFTPYGNE